MEGMRCLFLVVSLATLRSAAAQPAPPDPGDGSTDGTPAAVAATPTAPSTAPALGHDSAAEIVDTTLALKGDVRGYAKGWLIGPQGGAFGGELRMISSRVGPSGSAIAFHELALFTLSGRWTVSNRVEVSAHADLLTKQPDDRRDTAFQGGGAGVRTALTRRTALEAGVSGGPTMGNDGRWGNVAVGAAHRSAIERFLSLEISGGADTTQLRQQSIGRRWLAELAFSSKLLFHSPGGEIAMWGGVDMGFPVVHSSGLDPTSRLGLDTGLVYSATSDWDLFFEVKYCDRGTITMPESTLPIIDGGFDQTQMIFGITRRFTPRGTGMWALAM